MSQASDKVLPLSLLAPAVHSLRSQDKPDHGKLFVRQVAGAEQVESPAPCSRGSIRFQLFQESSPLPVAWPDVCCQFCCLQGFLQCHSIFLTSTLLKFAL